MGHLPISHFSQPINRDILILPPNHVSVFSLTFPLQVPLSSLCQVLSSLLNFANTCPNQSPCLQSGLQSIFRSGLGIILLKYITINAILLVILQRFYSVQNVIKVHYKSLNRVQFLPISYFSYHSLPLGLSYSQIKIFSRSLISLQTVFTLCGSLPVCYLLFISYYLLKDAFPEQLVFPLSHSGSQQ